MGLKIYSSNLDLSNLQCSICKVLEAIPASNICGLVFCGVSETVEYHQLLDNLKSIVYSSLNKKIPITLIPQHLLPNGGLAIEVYTLDAKAEIKFEEKEGVCYGLTGNDNESMLFIEGIPASDFSDSVRLQSEEVFDKLDTILSASGFEVDDIVPSAG